MEYNLLPVDVVAKPEAAEGKPPLTFAERDGSELLDTLGTAAVVRVNGEDLDGSGLESPELRVAFEEGPGEALEPGSGADRKRRRHAL